MKKCHYIFDKEAGKVLIPECFYVVHSNNIEDCTCRKSDKPSYEDLERENFNLKREVSALKRNIRLIKKTQS